MPFPVSVGDLVEVRLRMVMNSQRLMNVFHYRVSSGSSFDGKPDLEEMLQIMDDPATGFMPAYKACCSTELTFSRLDAQIIYPTRYITISRALNYNGLKVGTALPQNVQASITKRVNEVGESVTGRTEIPGLTTADVENGTLTFGAISEVTDIANQIKATITLVTGTLVLKPIVYHRAQPVTSQDIADVWVQDTIRVARRRTVSVGK